jgi:DNA helicase MCM9
MKHVHILSTADTCGLQVQEQVQKLGVGSIPRSIVVLLQDDLVDTCKAGDEVTIVGMLLRRWKAVCADARCNVEVIQN